MQGFKNILVIMLALGLVACASLREQDAYIQGQTWEDGQPISLPADLNKADVEDYYRIPDIVHKNNQEGARAEITPPKVD